MIIINVIHTKKPKYGPPFKVVNIFFQPLGCSKYSIITKSIPCFVWHPSEKKGRGGEGGEGIWQI